MTSKALLSLVEARSAEIIERASLRAKLTLRRNLRVKLGIDPTSPDLHLGHVVPLRILRAFQDAGHRAVLIVGDFTGQIGDPAGKTATRRQLPAAEAKANERTYRAQVARVLNLARVEIRHNREWYGRMRVGEFLDLLTKFSLRRAWERGDFQRRLRAGREVRMHEAMYPVLQAYDSVMVRADVEIGAIDQKLNILAGRELQRGLGFRQPPQDAILLPYLIGLDGTQKMSKSAGNTINIGDSAAEMFGKVMSVPDAPIVNYAELAAWLQPQDVARLKDRLRRGENPRDVKLDVAEAVTALYHRPPGARRAREAFIEQFSRHHLPHSIPSTPFAPGIYPSLELLARLDPSRSQSELRRLLRGGAVAVDGRRLKRADESVTVRRGSMIRIGKKRLLRIR